MWIAKTYACNAITISVFLHTQKNTDTHLNWDGCIALGSRHKWSKWTPASDTPCRFFIQMRMMDIMKFIFILYIYSTATEKMTADILLLCSSSIKNTHFLWFDQTQVIKIVELANEFEYVCDVQEIHTFSPSSSIVCSTIYRICSYAMPAGHNSASPSNVVIIQVQNNINSPHNKLQYLSAWLPRRTYSHCYYFPQICFFFSLSPGSIVDCCVCCRASCTFLVSDSKRNWN